jgi:hypothetical protein
MKIAITWDYELFFGEKSGTVNKCLLDPSFELLKIAQNTNAKFTFFVDSGMLYYGEKEQNFLIEHNQIVDQIKGWDKLGHETGLHIHPHWEDAIWKGQWQFNLNRYKLNDFIDEEINNIFNSYLDSLKKHVQNPIFSYRAGGWCIQPFSRIKNEFSQTGLKIDSSVFPGGINIKSPYYYNFTNHPDKEKWSFEDNVCEIQKDGPFLEIPIAAQKYSPLFFWKLFLLGRLNPKIHKPLGDGFPAKGGGSKKDLLTKSHHLCVSADGYFVTKIEKAIRSAEEKKWNSLVIIGHPKACTRFSLSYLELLISKLSNKHEFVCLRDLAE